MHFGNKNTFYMHKWKIMMLSLKNNLNLNSIRINNIFTINYFNDSARFSKVNSRSSNKLDTQ